jgi:hypothetical protein
MRSSILATVAVAVVACSTAGDSPTNGSPDGDAGKAYGTARQVVGAQGARVVSTDQRLAIDIPAGALTEDVEIAITPAANPRGTPRSPAFLVRGQPAISRG